MKMTVIRVMEYDRHLIHLMHFKNVFQYLVADRFGKIYQDHVTLNPTVYGLIRYWFKLAKSPYTNDQLDTVEKILFSGAMGTIDELTKDTHKHEKKMQEISEFAQKKKKKVKGNHRCTWRATGIDEGEEKMWECLVHNVAVPMIDGVKPEH